MKTRTISLMRKKQLKYKYLWFNLKVQIFTDLTFKIKTHYYWFLNLLALTGREYVFKILKPILIPKPFSVEQNKILFTLVINRVYDDAIRKEIFFLASLVLKSFLYAKLRKFA